MGCGLLVAGCGLWVVGWGILKLVPQELPYVESRDFYENGSVGCRW